MKSLPTALFMLTLVLSISAQNIRYVKPSDGLVNCLDRQPCLTLGQYTKQMDTYFTTDSVFLLLAGNHGLRTAVNINNVSNIIIRGEKGSNIVSTNDVSFLYENTREIVVEGLIFRMVLKFSNCSKVLISNSRFQGNGMTTGGLSSQYSVITIMNCIFHQHYKQYGGALHVTNSNISIIGSEFIRNGATAAGGAIYAYKSSISLNGTLRNNFFLNSGESSGGAIECKHCTLRITGCNLFQNNTARHRDSLGGAIRVIDGELIITDTTCTLFSGNEATEGGAICLHSSDASLSGAITFEENIAKSGGAIAIIDSSLVMKDKSYFVNNKAYDMGGAISIPNRRGVTNRHKEILLSGKFENNKAKYGGAAFLTRKRLKLTIENITVTGNSESGLWISDCNITIRGRVSLVNNTGRSGGGIYSRNSVLDFVKHTIFNDNDASFGGAFYLLYGSISFSGNTQFTHNTAIKDGGALYVVGTRISIKGTVDISFNAAHNGGAIYLESGAFLTLKNPTNLTTSQNRASEYGGAIYHQDSVTPIQCNYANKTQFEQLPYCFLQFKVRKTITFFLALKLLSQIIHVHSNNDSAGKDGSFLFGGLLDRCQLEYQNNRQTDLIAYKFVQGITIRSVQMKNSASTAITSKPYSMCFCNENGTYDQVSCSYNSTVLRSIHTSQKFSVYVIALAQGATATSTTVTALLSPTARLRLSQSVQELPDQCTNLTYNIYSGKSFEQVILHPEGPCYANGLAKVTINVTLKPCPDAFVLSDEQLCICEERLREYGVNCTIDEEHAIIKRTGSKLWLSALYENKTYQGLILHKTCPAQYCKTGDLAISLGNPDIQCDKNRSGVLCGACAANYSLMLGSSQCGECSDNYLSLLLPFAAAGIALVAFLSVLRLTVATGMVNSVIFYANIVQVNRNFFFHGNGVNVLTIFVAWMNLDLGFETCFYNGMTAHAQTWLQFAFPIYVWLLIGLIVLVSRYSITVSKLIGSNPIAVLATLLLMSYNKILKIIIEVYSCAQLSYPQNKTVSVWLKDANVPCLRSWHLPLIVVTSLVLVFFFLPYTLLLLLGYELYRFSSKKYFHWLNRIKPLLDSYYAPYKTRTRYWTGFLLLVRCGLYIVFSSNSLVAISAALIIALGAIVIKAWLFGRIYERLYLDIIESSIYLNLIVLSTLTFADSNPIALVYSLVGTVFVTMIGIIVYHIIYTMKSLQWLRSVCRKKIKHLEHLKTPKVTNTTITNEPPGHGSTKIVSTSLIELREPLLDD